MTSTVLAAAPVENMWIVGPVLLVVVLVFVALMIVRLPGARRRKAEAVAREERLQAYLAEHEREFKRNRRSQK